LLGACHSRMFWVSSTMHTRRKRALQKIAVMVAVGRDSDL
jgi:hypothetical protein